MRTASSRRLLAVTGAAVCLGAAAAWGAGGALAIPAATATGSVFIVQGVDGTTLDISVDGKEVAADAAAKAVVGPLTLTAGSHVLEARGSGGPVTATLTVKAGSSSDAVVHRPVEANQPPIITVYPNDLSAVSSGSGRLTVAHDAAVGPADIRVNGQVMFENVANGEQLTLVVPADTYSVDIVPTAASSPVVFGPVDLPVAKAALTRVFAIGVAATGSMDAVVQVLPLATRGSGATPAGMDAGDGGQAQSLIGARARGERASSGQGVPLGLAVLGAAGVAALLAVRRRRALSADRSVG